MMKHIRNASASAAIVCCGALLSGAASAVTIDLTVTKVVQGQDTGAAFGFDLYQPGTLIPFNPVSLTTFELQNGESADFAPILGFFVTETAGSNQLVDIAIQGAATNIFGGAGYYDTISWVGAANTPNLPGYLDFLSGVIPENGAGGVCLAASCSFDVTFTNVSAVPLPAAAWLFGSGLIGLAGIARRRRA
jgi:hypothetical protein